MNKAKWGYFLLCVFSCHPTWFARQEVAQPARRVRTDINATRKMRCSWRAETYHACLFVAMFVYVCVWHHAYVYVLLLPFCVVCVVVVFVCLFWWPSMFYTNALPHFPEPYSPENPWIPRRLLWFKGCQWFPMLWELCKLSCLLEVITLSISKRNISTESPPWFLRYSRVL